MEGAQSNMVIVRNVKSDSRWEKPKDGRYSSWIDYWNVYCLEYEPDICPCCHNEMKNNGGAVGGHVRKVDEPHGDVYITPICDSCNKKFKNSKTYDIEFEVKDEMLIHANYNKLTESDGYYDLKLCNMLGLNLKDLNKK